MKVSKKWLSELVDLKVDMTEVERLLPLRTIATKEINDQFIELDMKGYNRADLLSMRGVAYEVAAITNSQVTFIEDESSEISTSTEEKLKVTVENPDLAPIYYLIKVERLKIDKSTPEWIQKLEDSGIRSVNNVTDITNLIMLEYGQPLHAFNAESVKDETIIIRNSSEGETLVTLDNKERELTKNDLLITDSEKILGLAGVMGGKDSEIPESGEVTILLEAAIFDPISLRKTATRLGLISEASKRFYHGLAHKRLIQALNRAISYYQALGGTVTATAIVGKKEDQQPTVVTRHAKINQLIGVDIEPESIEAYLESLLFSYKKHDEGWIVTAPYWRHDIEIEEDVIEEVARMYGYENIPANELTGALPEKIDQSTFELITSIKNKLVEKGLTEVQTYSFYSTEVLKNLGFYEGDNLKILIKVANPISSETEYMRMNIWPNLVEAAAKNLKSFDDVAIFEVGKIHEIKDNTPVESFRLSVLLVNGSNNPIAELYQIISAAFEEIELKLEIKRTTDPVQIPLFHPTRFMSIKKDGENIGGLAEVHSRVTDKFSTNKRAAILEINLDN